MKCQSCDCILTDRESVRKSINTGDYLDLCDGCLAETDITVLDNLSGAEYFEDEDGDEHLP